jgi:hypothetical protein
MTKNDVIELINKKSPHVISIIIQEKPGEVVILLDVPFFYWLFFSRSFHSYIDGHIQKHKMPHLKYTVKII